MSELEKLRISREEEETTNRPSGWGKKIALLLFVVAVMIGGYFIFAGPLKPAKEVQATTATAVYPSQANSVLNASGYVVAQRKAEVASKATGKLESLSVEEGTRVKKGQIIGRLDSQDVAASLEQAKADLQVTKASLVEASANFDRQKSLWDAKIGSRSEHDLAEASYKRAAASVRAAEARIRAAEVQMEYTYIRAPFDGTVLTKNADVGEIVAPFGSAGNSKGAVVSMADMDSLQVEADVSESNIERVRVGQPCEITLDAFPEKRYRGEIHMIVPTADRAKATVLTKVRFLDQDERVLPEMSAKVAFLSKELEKSQVDAKPKITIDPAAVLDRGTAKIVFLIQKEQITERTVKLGGMVGSAVEVLEGISAGDQVVLNPSADLKTGTKIKIAA